MSNTPYNNEGRIALFPNDKGANPKRPDYRGDLQLDGVKYKISLWAKQTKDGSGRTYWAGQVEQAKDGDRGAGDTIPKRAEQTQTTTVPSKRDDDNDSIPF